MKKKDIEPGLTQEHVVAEPILTNIAPLVKTDVEATSQETKLNEASIRELAFRLYEQRGRQDGHDIENWLDAEAMILSQGKQAA